MHILAVILTYQVWKEVLLEFTPCPGVNGFQLQQKVWVAFDLSISSPFFPYYFHMKQNIGHPKGKGTLFLLFNSSLNNICERCYISKQMFGFQTDFHIENNLQWKSCLESRNIEFLIKSSSWIIWVLPFVWCGYNTDLFCQKPGKISKWILNKNSNNRYSFRIVNR